MPAPVLIGQALLPVPRQQQTSKALLVDVETGAELSKCQHTENFVSYLLTLLLRLFGDVASLKQQHQKSSKSKPAVLCPLII